MRRHVAVKGHRGLYFSDSANGKRYEVAYRDVDGKRHFRVVGPDLQQALVEQAKTRVKLSKGVRAYYPPVTFGAVAEEWEQYKSPSISPASSTRYRGLLNNHLLPKFGDRKISSITTDQIALHLASLRTTDGKVMSGSTRQGAYVVLHSVMEYAANTRRGYIAVNPCSSLEAGERPRVKKPPFRVLSPEEAKSLLVHSEEWFKPVLLTAMYTGLRAGEILGLRWENIDFAANEISVVGQIRPDRTYAETKGKNQRHVPLLPALRPVLFDMPSRFGGGYVFVIDGGPISYSLVSLTFRRAREKAGIGGGDKHLTLHACRHTFASALLRDGKDIIWVSSLLGHRSPKVTLDTYAHVIQRDNRNEEASMRLSEALGELG